jgi:hypothetical protein
MNKKGPGLIDRFFALFDSAPSTSTTGDTIFWGTALSALLAGAVASTIIIVKVRQQNSLEERVRLLRMCREDPSFDPKKCAELTKAKAAVGKRTSAKARASGTAYATKDDLDDRPKDRFMDLRLDPYAFKER